MCGRYNVSDSPLVRALMATLGMAIYPDSRRNIAPGAHGQFVIERGNQRNLIDGYWSLLIEPKPDGSGYRPNPAYSTFNARADALTTKPLWRKRFRSQRAIVPATGFHEWKDGRVFQVEQSGQALALAGLYEFWEIGDEVVPAFSVITLPPHPKFSHIHEKSLPLMLEPGDFDMWLDPNFTQVEAFADLLQPRLRRPLLVTLIDSPKTLLPVGEVELIGAD